MATKISRTLTQLPIASSSRLFSTSSIASNSSPSSHVPAQPTGDVSSLPFTYNDFKGPEYPQREPLPRTHSIPVAHLTLSAHHPYNLDLYSQFAWHSAQSLGIPAARPAPLKKRQELITVIKAPFVHKKYQENFERRHHHRQIVAYDANKEVVDLWLRYVKQNRIGGVGLKATVFEWVEPGFGEKELQGVKEQLEKPDSDVLQEAQRLLKEMGEGGLLLGSTEEASTASASEPATTEEVLAPDAAEASATSTQTSPSPESETGEKKVAPKEAKDKQSSEEKEVKEKPSKTEGKPTKAKSPSKVVKSLPKSATPEKPQESVDQRSIGETEMSTSEDLPKEAKETAQKP